MQNRAGNLFAKCKEGEVPGESYAVGLALAPQCCLIDPKYIGCFLKRRCFRYDSPDVHLFDFAKWYQVSDVDRIWGWSDFFRHIMFADLLSGSEDNGSFYGVAKFTNIAWV